MDYCDGGSTTAISNNYCLIPMQTFIDAPYNLVQGDLIIATVQALNSIGWSDASQLNISGQSVETKPPVAPKALIVDLSKTNENQIALEMTAMIAVSETGGSPIVSYSLEWDDASSQLFFTSLIGETVNNIQLLYTKTGLTPGVEYAFKYRARNIYGWSPYS